MTKEEIINELNEKGLKDIVDLIHDAEKGYLEELELAEQVGLLHDERLNDEVIKLLEENNVKIIYLRDDEEDDEDEEAE